MTKILTLTMTMTKRSLLLHLCAMLAAATFASGQAGSMAAPLTADDLAAEIPRTEITRVKKSKNHAEAVSVTQPLTDGLRKKWRNKPVVLKFKSRAVEPARPASGGVSQHWYVWSDQLTGGKGAEKMNIRISGELRGTLLDKGKAIRAGSEVIVSGTVQDIFFNQNQRSEETNLVLNLLVDDIVKAK